jgi:alpha-tubulin suppressor-like RCC1 family protein
VTTSGGAKCWGNNAYGQLGNSTTTSSKTPVDVDGLTSGVAMITAGSGHACAVTTTGVLKCWGNNASGQLGDGSKANKWAPDKNILTGVASVEAGDSHTCAVTTTGGAKCWGSNASQQSGGAYLTPGNVTGLTSGVLSISAGAAHSCAVTTSNEGKCWGSNQNGQLGKVGASNSATPVDVGT